jgi:NAD(P)-dependent dehydrogenase (short-subunit alcohol dehydrogenase family)
VLVVNAGAFTPGSIFETTPASFRAQLDANLTSAFLTTHAFLTAMAARGSGHLFYLGSVASLRGYAGGAAYSAAKHGVLGLARVVREETKAHGLRVTTLLPGAARTPSWDGTDVPDERFMPAEDVAALAVAAWKLSGRSVVEEVLVRPQLGDL